MEKHLSHVSKTHIPSTRDQLHSLKKEFDKPIASFLPHAKALGDSLATTGSPLFDSNLIELVTDSLGHTYKEFITSLHACQITSFDEFYDLAVQEENLLKRMSSLALSTRTALIANHILTPPSLVLGETLISIHTIMVEDDIEEEVAGLSHQTDNRGHKSIIRLPILPTAIYSVPTSINTIACQICKNHGHTAQVCNEKQNLDYNVQFIP